MADAPTKLTAAQVAERLNISVSSVYALVKAGTLTSYRFGVGRGSIRIDAASVAAYEADCRQGPAIEAAAAPAAAGPARPGAFSRLRAGGWVPPTTSLRVI